MRYNAEIPNFPLLCNFISITSNFQLNVNVAPDEVFAKQKSHSLPLSLFFFILIALLLMSPNIPRPKLFHGVLYEANTTVH